MEAPSCVRAGSWEEGGGGGGEGEGGGEKDIPSFSSSQCFDCLTFRQIQRVSPSPRRIHQRARVFTRVVAQVSLPPSSAGIVNCTQAHSSTPITASTTQETTHEPRAPLALVPCKVTSPSICCMRATDPKPPLSPSLIPLADRLHGKPSVGGSHRGNRKGRSGEGFSATYWNINS